MRDRVGCALSVTLVCLALGGCAKRDQPPPTPDYLPPDAMQPDQPGPAVDPASGPGSQQGECSWKTGGCAEDQLCWDSWYCKQGLDEQCTAMGDQRCHPRCQSSDDCPEDMPRCVQKPIFKGSERGVVESFCVSL